MAYRFMLALAGWLVLGCGQTGPASQPAQAERTPTQVDTPTTVQASDAAVSDSDARSLPPDASEPDATMSLAPEESSNSTKEPPNSSERARPRRRHRPRVCKADRWDGWEGTRKCKKFAKREVKGKDRSCRVDADCVLLGTTCDPHPVNTASEAKYRKWPYPCTSPSGGQCDGPTKAVCSGGCCSAYTRL